jgi:hypothetical protein
MEAILFILGMILIFSIVVIIGFKAGYFTKEDNEAPYS